MNTTETIATEIAKEVLELPSFDLQSVTSMVERRIKDSMYQLAGEHKTRLEHQLYLKKKKAHRMLESNNKKDYIKLGSEISILNMEIKYAGRFQATEGAKRKIGILKDVIKHELGEEFLTNLYKEID